MKHYIIVAFGLHVFFLTVLLIWRGFNSEETFSQKAAKSNLTVVLYPLSFILPFIFMYQYFVDWLIPVFQLSYAFYIFVLVALGFQILCTLFPEREGWMKEMHRILTGISAIALLPMLLILALNSSVSDVSRITCLIAIASMMWVLVIALRNQHGHKHALWLQIGYYGSFFAAMLFTTYL